MGKDIRSRVQGYPAWLRKWPRLRWRTGTLQMVMKNTEEIGLKVAIARDGNNVSAHFGHCQEYTIFTVEGSQIVMRQDLANPGHEPGRLPALLAEHKVTHVLAGGMGPRAVDLFCANHIDVLLGISGPVDDVIQAFLEGKISPGQSSCHHTHECS